MAVSAPEDTGEQFKDLVASLFDMEKREPDVEQDTGKKSDADRDKKTE